MYTIPAVRRGARGAMAIGAVTVLMHTVTAAVPDDWRKNLPEPVLSDHGDWVDLYYDTWRIADSKKVERPSGWTFDDAFDRSGMWMWDQVWITTYGKYLQGAHADVTNPMAGIDQFYASQDGGSGYMSHVWPRDIACIHNPIFTLGERSWFNHCADTSRLRRVLPVLEKFYYYAENEQGSSSGMYRDACWHNGLENRPTSDYLVDLTAEQAMVARDIREMAKILGESGTADEFREEHEALKKLMNEKMWSSTDRFYVDVDANMNHVNNWTAAAYWTLLARIPDEARAEAMVDALFDPSLFKTPHVIPCLALKSRGFDDPGIDYCRGAVYIVLTTMILKGMLEYGYNEEAHEIAMDHLAVIAQSWKDNGTLYECYDAREVGRPGGRAKSDFVGWTGVTPIANLIEFIIGIRVDAPRNRIVWDVNLTEKHGIRNLRWGRDFRNEVSMVAGRRAGRDEPVEIDVTSSRDFTLEVKVGTKGAVIDIPEGSSRVTDDRLVTGLDPGAGPRHLESPGVRLHADGIAVDNLHGSTFGKVILYSAAGRRITSVSVNPHSRSECRYPRRGCFIAHVRCGSTDMWTRGVCTRK